MSRPPCAARRRATARNRDGTDRRPYRCPGASYVLVNDHDPKPLRYQFAAENAGEFSWEGFGEAPVGFKGTLTAWASSAAASEFAFRSDVHIDVIRRTPIERWYAEELFTRFALLAADGTLDGAPAARLADEQT